MPDVSILLQQARRALAIAEKDVRIYYSKGPVIIFGLLFPLFLFLAFAVGRELTVESMLPGLLAMVLFFTSTAISPAVAPWETQARTLERLMSCPVSIPTIVFGDVLASFAFGVAVSLVPLVLGLVLGASLFHPFLLPLAILLAAFCFSCLGLILSAPRASTPATIMMLSSMVKFPVVFISGVFIPLSELPSWGRLVAYVSPLTYFTDIARAGLQGQAYLPLSVDFAVLVGFSIGFAVLATRLHARTMPSRI